MKDYDIRSAFEEIEIELIESMKRNLDRHKKWETDEGINWSMWQAEQLKTLEEFKKKNKKIFNKRFSVINQAVKEVLKDTYKTSGFQQEREILEAIEKNKSLTDNVTKGLEGAFFSLDEGKMNALINATIKDMSKAEHAVLRMTNDQYRKTIFKAQVMSNSGAFTLQQSIDAATKDFLKAGINCVQYKNGRRVNIASYSEMCLRTSTKRAKLVAEGEARNANGIHTVKISKYGQCSETCLPWQGKVYVDDVWSGGTKGEATEKKLPLLSEAIKGGFFHPNCKHVSYTYFYDFKKSLGKLQEDGVENPLAEQEHHKNQLHIQQQKRLEKGSLDPQNIKEAKARKEQWIEKDEQLLESHPELQENKNSQVEYTNFKTGVEVNDFFYYDNKEKGVLLKKKSTYGKWYSGLSKDEYNCISDYTGAGYGDVNDFLRKRNSWDTINKDKVMYMSKHLDSAISKFHLKDNIVVQRGVMDDALDEIIGKYNITENSEFIGKIYHDEGYMSTSALFGNRVATSKPVVFEINVPAGTGNGAYVNKLSGFKDVEYEFLLKRGADYKITEVIEDNFTGKLTIKMDMIN